jgi:hypothetical protein
MVLPIGELTLDESVEVIDATALPTKTYKLDIKNGRCAGMVEGKEAMEQAIFKMLSTVRFVHLIYPDEYGFEELIGQDEIFVRAELPRRIKETLQQDSRITNVVDFKLESEGDSSFISFTCETIYGDVQMLKEVSAFV